ncbi:hypothetical protein ACUC2M_19150 [Bacillus cytotoxicus]
MREPYKKRNGRRVITSLLCLSVLTTPIVSEVATEQTNNSKITSKEQIGHMILQVTPSNPTPMPGETITYRYKLTNATNKVIKDVWIADWNVNMLQGRFDLDNDNAFGPGETITMTKKIHCAK